MKTYEKNPKQYLEFHSPKKFDKQNQRYKKKSVDDLLELGHEKECACCGVKENLSVDHIKPIAKEGTYDPNNLQILCKECNGLKGNRELNNMQLRKFITQKYQHEIDSIQSDIDRRMANIKKLENKVKVRVEKLDLFKNKIKNNIRTK